MTVKLLPAADRAATPWKNGGGITREVATFPPRSSFDDFHWRVSMAEVLADGPFSIFTGVDRILAVVEGCLRLEVASHPPVRLARGDLPAVFSGDIPTVGVVEAGPVLDLNIMTRRGRTRPTLVRFDAEAVLGPGTQRLVLAVGGVRVGKLALDSYDGALIEKGAAAQISPTPGAFAYVVSFDGG